MAPRTPYQDIQLNDTLKPASSPVDTFVQAPESPLKELGRALEALTPGLREMSARKDEQKAKEDAILGERDALTKNEEGYNTAVRDGVIPPQYSPARVAAYKSAQGELAGGRLLTDFSTAFNSWEAKDTATDEDFDTFLTDYLKNNIKQDDPYVLKGLLPKVAQLEANARQTWIAHRANVMEKTYLDSSVGNVMQDVVTTQDAGDHTSEGPDYTSLWPSIQKRREDYIKTGGSAEKFDRAIVEGMAVKARETGDEKLLEFWEQTIPGTTTKYKDMPDFLKVRNATQEAIIADKHQQLVEEATTIKAQKEALKDEATSGIIDDLRNGRPVDEARIKQAEQNGDPLIRTRIKEWGESMKDSPKKADPEAVQALQEKMINDPTNAKKYLKDAMSGILKGDSAATTSIYQLAESLDKDKDRVMEAFSGTTMTQYISGFQKATGEKGPMGDLLSGISPDAARATSDYKRMMFDWISRHPEATPYEIDEQAQKLGAAIQARMVPVTDFDPEKPMRTYERDPNIPLPDTLGQITGMATEDATKSADQPKDGMPLSDQPEETQKKIKEEAGKLNIRPEEHWENIKKQTEGDLKKINYDPSQDLGPDPMGNDARDGGLTLEKATAFIEEAQARIKDLPEGGPSGNVETNLLALIRPNETGTQDVATQYNMRYGGKTDIDLSTLSVNDVLRQQFNAKVDGVASTAIGAYQIKYSTLKGLRTKLGLTGDEKFTPELQDRMGAQLLKDRGLEAYLAGKISQKQFALQLSQEWAALPNPNTNRSYYDGDGLNNSRTHVRKVYEAMGFAPEDLYQQASYEDSGPYNGGLRFNHPDQERGVKEQLKSAVASTFQELGIPEATIMSGYRSPNHSAERNKKNGGGEHTHGNAMDVSMKGLNDDQRKALVQGLIAKGVMRFITYDKYPDMLHVDIKEGTNRPYYMHNRSARNLSKAPAWFKALAFGTTDA